MGIRVPFHLVLLATFAGLTAVEYQQSKTRYDELSATQLQQFQAELKKYADTSSGDTLYQQISKDVSFNFFQYISAEDSRFNFTHGALNANPHPVMDLLFPISNKQKQNIGNATLQVVLSRPEQTEQLLTALQRTGLTYLGGYLILLVSFMLFVSSVKKRVRYAAQYISQIPNLNYASVASSKLGGIFKPVSNALENCRKDLKKAMDEVAVENDQLQKVAFHDYLTGFGTPQKFSAKLDTIFKDQRPRLGVIAQIKATELSSINQDKGREAGDDYLLHIANIIRATLKNMPEAECFRINSGDFAIYIPDLAIAQAETTLGQLKVEFNSIQSKYVTDSIAYTGVVPCQSGAEPSTILNHLDTAITIALTQSPNSVYIMEKAPDDINAGEHQWQTIINAIVDNKTIEFFQQPIQPSRTGAEGYTELLARFHNHAGNALPTQTVLAMAKRYEMSDRIDKAIIATVLEILASSPNLTSQYGINISGESITNNEFLLWMKNVLLNQRALASRLVFEVSENSMQSNLLAASRFVKLCHALGAKVSVEQFGHGFTSFKFFREVLPDYIKLDGSYSHRIDQDGNNRFYVRTLVDISRRAGIQVVATAIERQEEKIELEKLLVDGMQGFYISRPQELQVNRKVG
ncbi:EAL domain-containing protein [Shewanella submarina]|uniref:EAL domain-containing protein n=1 Tax=Shewanella submarina TaxID=2016376 RepID=A0ABV7G9H3_9GAMM|nr:EAL domain-containing protein [Shewanella submarina]MCL1039988.1 EAL domain-containing protein [Shewanella submarina]